MFMCIETDLHHCALQPFFLDNCSLLKFYEMLKDSGMSNNTIDDHIRKLRLLLNSNGTVEEFSFFTFGVPSLKGIHFKENDWSKRLVGGLHHLPHIPPSNIKFTAPCIWPALRKARTSYSPSSFTNIRIMLSFSWINGHCHKEQSHKL